MAPTELMHAPSLSVFFRPRRLPQKAAARHPTKFPNCTDGSGHVFHVKTKTTYRETTRRNALDIRDLRLREGIDEVRTDQNAAHNALLNSSTVHDTAMPEAQAMNETYGKQSVPDHIHTKPERLNWLRSARFPEDSLPTS